MKSINNVSKAVHLVPIFVSCFVEEGGQRPFKVGTQLVLYNFLRLEPCSPACVYADDAAVEWLGREGGGVEVGGATRLVSLNCLRKWVD